MSKSKTFIKLTTICLLIVAGILLAVCPFKVPFSNYKFSSFFGGLNYSHELKGGAVAVYEASLDDDSEEDLNEKIDETILGITKILERKGYKDVSISKQGENKIRVEVSNLENTSNVLSIIGEPSWLIITDAETRSAITDESIQLTGEHIKKVEYISQGSSHIVAITFNNEGKKLLENLSRHILNSDATDKVIQFHLYKNNEEAFSRLSIEDVIKDGVIYISGGNITTKDAAENYILQVLSGTLDINLKTLENTTFIAEFGENTLRNFAIAGAISLFLILVMLYMLYKNMGIAAAAALLINLVLFSFFLSVLPFVIVSTAGIIGILFSFAVAVNSNVIMFERIKHEFNKGKKIKTSINDGYNKSIFQIVSAHVVLFFVSLFLTLFSAGFMQQLAITLVVGTVISALTTLLLTKYMLNVFVKINAKDAKKYALKRENK